jgi:hypothetical protein
MEQPELNIDGEPKYMRLGDGTLIINDPTLVREIPNAPEEVAPQAPKETPTEVPPEPVVVETPPEPVKVETSTEPEATPELIH